MSFVEITPEEFAEYAKTSPYKSFMQTPEIAKYREKSGWKAYFLALKEDNKIEAATMLVGKRIFLGKSIFITPGGPLLDFENTQLARHFLSHLKKFAKSHGGFSLQISPYYELVERGREGHVVEGGFYRRKALITLKDAKFRAVEHPSQPKYLFAMDLKGKSADTLFTELKRNTRNHVRKAEKMGVKIRELNREELPILKQITESTSERRHFTDRPLSYYEEMYDLFHDKGEAKFMVAEAKVGTDATCSAGHEDLARAARSVPEGHAASVSTLASDTSSTALSAAMFMLYGDEIVYLFSGSDEKYMRDYNAQYLIQWHMIKYAADHGFKRYNFYGIHGLPDDNCPDGIYDFKKGFTTDETGRVIELIGTFEAPLDPTVSKMYHLLLRLHH